MRLVVSVSSWGERRGTAQRYGGLYIVDLAASHVVSELVLPVAQGASHAFAGVAVSGDRLYASYMAGPDSDQILEIDRATFRVLRRMELHDVFDVHQMDVFSELLWITNTNLTQVVVLTLPDLCELGRFHLNPPPPEERQLSRTQSTNKMIDPRRRIHLNSIRVGGNAFYLGHFGIHRGDFHSSQLMRVPWNKRANTIDFGPPEHLPICGMRFPHNVFLDPAGVLVGCDSGSARFVVGDRTVRCGGWPRGLAISDQFYVVGLSSYAPNVDRNRPRDTTPVRLLIISRASMRIVGEFTFPAAGAAGGDGQLYDIRLLDQRDYGTSEGACNRAEGNPQRLTAGRT